jgi:hypothetical protein
MWPGARPGDNSRYNSLAASLAKPDASSTRTRNLTLSFYCSK